MANQINPQSVIPSYWKGIYVTSDAELVFYGSHLIRTLIQYWRNNERGCVDRIKDIQSKIDLLEGKTVDTLLEEASNYEHPEFPQIEVPSNSWSDDPEPVDVDSMNRKRGTTTFNVCGWCKFAEGGMGRYGYLITTSCGLLPRELGDGSGYGGSERFRFNTPCALTHGTDALLETSVKHLEVLREEARSQKSAAAEKVRYLLGLEGSAVKKPFTPGQRPHDWFNLGDEVMCFVDFEEAERKCFFLAKVAPGYRHHDGYVTAIAEERVHKLMRKYQI